METGEGGPADKKSNSPSMINTVMTVITHTLLLVPVVYIVVGYFLHYRLFSWHPVCMAVGVGLLLTEGVFAISGEVNLTSRVKRANRVTIHWILITAGLILMFIGLIIVIVVKNRLDKQHFASTHGQVGLIAIVIPCVAAGFGIIASNTRWLYPRVRPILIKVTHAIGGIAASVILIVATVNGAYKRSFPGGYVGRDFIFACYFLATILLLFKPVIGAISRTWVILKPPAPST